MRILAILGAVAGLVCSEARAENWPYWRGLSRQGASTETGLPVTWSAESNVVWKAAIPGEAWSSPIVHGKRIFLTSTTESGTQCHILCLDRDTGGLVWIANIFEQVPLRKEQRNSYATPTPATDGERVYAVFGDGSIVAVSADKGALLWENREAKFYSQHGLGASPILYQDLLIMPFDGSSTGENKRIGWQIPWDQAYLLALDAKTGAVRWKAARGPSRIAHVTPNVMKWQGKEVLVSGAGDVVQAFGFKDGQRLWSVYSQGEGVVPSIVVGQNLAFSVSGFEKPAVRAIRPPERSGQEPKIVWEQKKAVPMIPSFVLSKGRLFGVTEGGVGICLDEATGEIVWQERIGGNHSASPVLAEDRVYLLNEEGETTVIEASKTFKILARNPLGERCQASMAVSDRKLFIRSAASLFCIGSR